MKSELTYSLMSFSKIAGRWSKENIRILIYTEDNICLPECLDHLPVTFNYLKEEDIEEWVGRGNGHNLILKAHVMLCFLQHYAAYGILVDTDTFFIKDPAPIFRAVQQGYFLMHLKEYSIAEKPGIYSFFRRRKFELLNGGSYSIDPTFNMWNSGVIGIHPDYTPLLQEIVFLIEQISSEEEWPVEDRFLIEQTSYSYYLQKHMEKLLPTEEYIIHYWFFKQGRHLLGSYFNYFDETERNVELNNYSNLSYDSLPHLMVKIMKEQLLIRNYHFVSLPPDTYIGKILRSIQ